MDLDLLPKQAVLGEQLPVLPNHSVNVTAGLLSWSAGREAAMRRAPIKENLKRDILHSGQVAVPAQHHILSHVDEGGEPQTFAEEPNALVQVVDKLTLVDVRGASAGKR